MRAALADLPPLVEPVGGVTVHGRADGGMLVSRMHFPAGVDLTGLLPGGLCPVPHWGLVLEGCVHARYDDGSEESIDAGSVYHLRPGHTVWFDSETTMVEVSPEQEMRDVLERVMRAVAEAQPTRDADP